MTRLCFLVLLAICSSQVVAQEPDGPAKEEPAGLRVYIDPNTGQLTSQPTAEQRQRLDRLIRAQRQSRERPELSPFALRDGGVGVRLDDRFHSGLRVELDVTGSWRLLCDDQQGPDHDHGKPPEQLEEIPRDRAGNPVQ